MLKGKRILLVIAGGIAAFKAQELVRLLCKRDAAVRCVLTEAGAKFVTPLALQALTEDKVYTELFSLTDESEMGHIELSREADLLVVAPATAYDAKGLIKSAIRDNDPVIFFEHKGLYRRIKEELPSEEYTVPIGKAKVARQGKDLTIVTYGAMVWTALDAAEQLAHVERLRGKLQPAGLDL